MRRNPALEAKLVESPDDLEARRVYADWLMTQGEPWGEQIAHALAGRVVDFTGHGDLDDAFVWRDGFIEHIDVDGFLPEQAPAALERALALPQALLVRQITASACGNRATLAVIAAIKALRTLRIHGGDPIGHLYSHTLESLELHSLWPGIPRDTPLYRATHVPKLRHIWFDGKSPRGGVEVLIDSPLVRQLATIEIDLENDAVPVILARASELAHLKVIARNDRHQAALDEAFGAP